MVTTTVFTWFGVVGEGASISLSAAGDAARAGARVGRVLRLFRVLRLVKMFRFMKNLRLKERVSEKVKVCMDHCKEKRRLKKERKAKLAEVKKAKKALAKHRRKRGCCHKKPTNDNAGDLPQKLKPSSVLPILISANSSFSHGARRASYADNRHSKSLSSAHSFARRASTGQPIPPPQQPAERVRVMPKRAVSEDEVDDETATFK